MEAPELLRRPRAVSFTKVQIDDAFWSPRLETNRTRTILHEYEMCKQTGRIDAFLLDWRPGKEPMPHYFWDSDVAKWVEAASYSLATHPDPQLEALVDEVVQKIASAQQPDGYLNIYFTVVAPEKRWKNLGMWHELYCAGHLIEAAVAHYQATGKRTLLDVACRYADYIDSVFGPEPGKRGGCPGHQEIELALVKLYRLTGERRYLNLALFFLNQRGQKPSFFVKEMESLDPEDAKLNRHFFKKQGDTYDTSYVQDHLPVREQSVVVGHAVRAMYMYCGMVDVGVECGDHELLAAAKRLWDNLTLRRMYVTGGIGSQRANEGFTDDYDLPNESAYAETCAAVGLIFWAHRMLHAEPDGRYADILERVLYNGALSGVSLDGERFFYDNPLESRGNHHRQDWFGCSCCPPNIARLLASLGGYIYSEAIDAIYVHLYISGSARFSLGATEVTLRQESRYPWDGRIRITLEPDRQATFDLALRIPGWCRKARLLVNGEEVDDAPVRRGYVYVRRHWRRGDVIELELDMPVERVYAHPSVRQTAGCVALQRGPIVYCLEGVDHPFPLHRVVLPASASLKTEYEPDLLGGVVAIYADALLEDDAAWQGEGAELYRTEPPARNRVRIKAVPYYAWDNRAPGEMRVWIREEADL